jgi:hypothetical protein
MEIQILYEAALWYEDKNECSMAFWIQVLGNPSWTSPGLTVKHYKKI